MTLSIFYKINDLLLKLKQLEYKINYNKETMSFKESMTLCHTWHNYIAKKMIEVTFDEKKSNENYYTSYSLERIQTENLENRYNEVLKKMNADDQKTNMLGLNTKI